MAGPAHALPASRRPASYDARMPVLGRLAGGGLSLLPGALTVYISFNGGGFFVGTPALIAVVVAVLLILWLLLAPDPFATVNRRLALAVGALGLFALWTLISSGWSHSPGRALIAFDRAVYHKALAQRHCRFVAAKGVHAGGFDLLPRTLQMIKAGSS